MRELARLPRSQITPVCYEDTSTSFVAGHPTSV